MTPIIPEFETVSHSVPGSTSISPRVEDSNRRSLTGSAKYTIYNLPKLSEDSSSNPDKALLPLDPLTPRHRSRSTGSNEAVSVSILDDCGNLKQLKRSSSSERIERVSRIPEKSASVSAPKHVHKSFRKKPPMAFRRSDQFIVVESPPECSRDMIGSAHASSSPAIKDKSKSRKEKDKDKKREKEKEKKEKDIKEKEKKEKESKKDKKEKEEKVREAKVVGSSHDNVQNKEEMATTTTIITTMASPTILMKSDAEPDKKELTFNIIIRDIEEERRRKKSDWAKVGVFFAHRTRVSLFCIS